MNPTSNVLASGKSNAVAAIVMGGLACGVLDITAAIVIWSMRGIKLTRGLQGIASGLLGPTSFQGGTATAALGLAIHFFIAFSAAAVFYLASRNLRFLTERAVLWGFAYGVVVYLVMYWVVMPLSALRRPPFSAGAHALAIVIHMFCVGLPIALVVRRYSR